MKFEDVLPELRAGKHAVWNSHEIYMTKSGYILADDGSTPDWLDSGIGDSTWSIIDDPITTKANELYEIFHDATSGVFPAKLSLCNAAFQSGFLAVASSLVKK